jgi:hypothetical protein
MSTLVYGAFAGALGIGFFATQTSSFSEFLSVWGVGLLIAGACLLSGGLLGFLFGIPRTLQHDKAEGPPPNGDKNTDRSADASATYEANTNLEQISDWLTKILVGVGLVQLTAVPGAIQSYATFVSVGLGGAPASETVAVAILVFYLGCGFLISYLWTRLYLAGALRQADLGETVATLETRVSEVEQQSALDAKALGLVQLQLSAGVGTPAPPQADLDAAIGSASPAARGQIYTQAHDARSKNWQNLVDKPLMERTIPIFRALIGSDKDDVNHLYHGQLGFALKDQRAPDWAGAQSELTKAIQLRGPYEKSGWLFYEFNRALCQISVDPAFAARKSADPGTLDLIVADLTAAAHAFEIGDIIAADTVIQGWLAQNKVTWPPSPPSSSRHK